MNYKLAKQLKDAGFPQIGNGMFKFKDGKVVVRPDKIWNNGCYIPTLSELIEACGDGFGHIRQFKDFSGFEAKELKKNSWQEEIGKTPEVAVAKLWKKLNEK